MWKGYISILCLISLWITIKCVIVLGPIDGGYIIGLLADNTTALSWMSTAARTKNPLLQGRARLGSVLLVVAASLLTKFVPNISLVTRTTMF